MEINDKVEFARNMFKILKVTHKRYEDLEADEFFAPELKNHWYLFIGDDGSFLWRPPHLLHTQVIDEFRNGHRSVRG